MSNLHRLYFFFQLLITLTSLLQIKLKSYFYRIIQLYARIYTQYLETIIMATDKKIEKSNRPVFPF